MDTLSNRLYLTLNGETASDALGDEWHAWLRDALGKALTQAHKLGNGQPALVACVASTVLVAWSDVGARVGTPTPVLLLLGRLATEAARVFVDEIELTNLAN